MSGKPQFCRLVPGLAYSPSVEDVFKHHPHALSGFLNHWKPLIAQFRAAEEATRRLPTLGIIGEGARPLELIRRSLLIAPDGKPELPGNYFRLRWILLDTGGRNSLKRYCAYGQDLRYCGYLFKWLADQLGIDCYDQPIKQRSPITGRMELTQHFKEWISSRVVDLILMSTFGYLLPEWMIELFKNWIINFHPAEIGVNWPHTEFRGPKPYPKMLDAGVDMMVVVSYFIDGEFDRGSFLARSKPCSLHQVCREVLGTVRKPESDGEWFALLTRCHEVMAGPTGDLFQDLSLALFRGIKKLHRDPTLTTEQFKADHDSGFFS